LPPYTFKRVAAYINVLTPIKMKKILFIALGLSLFFTACKKSSPDDTTTTTTTTTITTPTGSPLDLMRDSVFLYAKEDYYWYDGLPDYATFNPRGFTGSTDIAALTTELNKISQYKINPATGVAYEYYSPAPGQAKYSFIDDGTTSTKLAGVTGDFGFLPFWIATSDLRVKYVYPGSPAANAGLKRGYKILSINGNSNLSYDGGTNYNFVVNAVTVASTITMTLLKNDGTNGTISVTFNTGSYTIQPVLTTKVLDQGNGKKIGYIVFNTFVSLSSAQSALQTAFSTFTTAGITDLVVDLRYNGGGYVETAQYLDNLIAPTSANGSLMYNTYFNPTLASNSETLLRNQVRKDPSTNQVYNYAQVDYSVAGNVVKFAKVGSLNISRVFFIVTGGTASASELTINSLRPYMNVQLIGNTTYGKPVGFFDININKYTMYIPEFETKNSAGQGGYYSGMQPGTSTYPGYYGADDVTKDFGDPTEALLAEAIHFVNFSTYSTPPALAIQSVEGTSTTFSADDQNTISRKMNNNTFNGMVMAKHILK